MTIASLLLGLVLQNSTVAAPPAAKPEDVATQDSIIKSLYDVISGPAGQKRDWDRFRSLFAPNGRLTAVVKNSKAEWVAVGMTPDDYVNRSGKVIEERGFFEKEVKRKIDNVQGMSMAWSDYESRMKADDEKPFQTGTNAIQMYSDGKRWFLLSVLWQAK
jgi:hypothetical protein